MIILKILVCTTQKCLHLGNNFRNPHFGKYSPKSPRSTVGKSFGNITSTRVQQAQHFFAVPQGLNIYDSFARVATYVELCSNIFFLSLNPPPLSNLSKSTCSTCSAFKIFQNIQNCNRHQSAQDAQAPKVFFLSGFHLWFLAFCTNMREEFVVRFPLAPHQFENKWTTKTLIIQHNLAYILFGLFWLWCLVKWILLYDVVCCPTFSKKFSFNAGATRVDFNIHPHGNPRHSWKKMGPCFYSLKPSKKRAF